MSSENASPYYLMSPSGIADRLSRFQRSRMFERFCRLAKLAPESTILDVGVTMDRLRPSANYLEAWYPHKEMITAVGLENAKFLEECYPGVRFVEANGLELPFPDRSFDVAFSSAVLEHVGSATNQIRFVQELSRVADKAIFLTTPNRWFPIELHTSLPLVHWLPRRTSRAIMAKLGVGFYADEANLNLVSRRDLLSMTTQVAGFAFEVESISLIGWPSNLLLIGYRQD